MQSRYIFFLFALITVLTPAHAEEKQISRADLLYQSTIQPQTVIVHYCSQAVPELRDDLDKAYQDFNARLKVAIAPGFARLRARADFNEPASPEELSEFAKTAERKLSAIRKKEPTEYCKQYLSKLRNLDLQWYVAALDPDLDKHASSAFLNAKAEIEVVAEECERMSKPNGEVFKVVAYIWMSEQYQFQLASDLALKDVDDSGRQTIANALKQHRDFLLSNFNKLDSAGKIAKCQSFKTHYLPFSDADPINAHALTNIIVNNEKIRISRRNMEMTVGCVKTAWKAAGGGMLSTIQDRCECQTKAITESATDEELDEWVSKLEKSNSVASPFSTNEKWFPRALQRIASCH